MLQRLVMIALLVMWTAPSWSAEETIVQQFSANGSRNTRPFTVKDRWEIRWDTKAPGIAISIRTIEGKLAQGGSSATAPGTGESFQAKGGTYYLDVSAMGEWTISIVQLP